MATATPQRELLTPAEVAEWLGVKVQTLAGWRYYQTGPAFTRVGRMVRYTSESIEAFIAAGQVKPR